MSDFELSKSRGSNITTDSTHDFNRNAKGSSIWPKLWILIHIIRDLGNTGDIRKYLVRVATTTLKVFVGSRYNWLVVQYALQYLSTASPSRPWALEILGDSKPGAKCVGNLDTRPRAGPVKKAERENFWTGRKDPTQRTTDYFRGDVFKQQS